MKKWHCYPAPIINGIGQNLLIIEYGEVKDCDYIYAQKRLTKDELLFLPDGGYKKVAKCKIVGNQFIYYNKAVCYDCGIGVKRNVESAKVYYQLAFQQESLDLDGETTFKNQNEYITTNLIMAPVVFKEGCEQGYPVALFLTGLCYLTGTGVKEDDKVANKYFKQSCDQRCAEAADALANSYYRGYGVKQNIATAIDYYYRAYRYGMMESGMHYAIILYNYGKRNEAMAMLLELQKKGYEPAIKMINQILGIW